MAANKISPSVALYSWSDQVFQQLFARSPDALIVAQEDGLVHWANTSAIEWLGIEATDIDRLPAKLLEDGEVESASGRFGESRVLHFEWQNQECLLISIRDVTFRHHREVALQQKTKRLQSLNANLEHLAHFDPLTSALNRRGLERKLTIEIERADREGDTSAAILVDFDDFKNLNNKFGHAVADRVLIHVTRIFKSMLRPQDLVARIGGDEFLLILPSTRDAEAMRVADRLRVAVERQPYESTTGPVPVTISLGLSRVCQSDGGISQVLSDARHALERGKNSGKNRVGISDEQGATLEPGLGQVLKMLNGSNSIRPVNLPIWDLTTNKVVAQEILSRGPKGPFEMPTDLFRACPDENVVSALDLICLKSCLTAGLNMATANERIHVNILPTTLQNVDPSDLFNVFPAGIPRERFCLEFSEQHVIGDPAKLCDILSSIREQGVSIAIDDVGFGRSSLEALVLLEPDIIKISRRFGRSVAKDIGLRRSFERLLRVAQALGATCIVEGIESEENLRVVRDLGAQFGQGFYWGRPQFIEEAN
ncbi:MAG: diguanylate cyclase (GGDEF)-like protein [Planctomycetota bacterium]|jgi:diguanylate cyclase (GGDEF)-like protein